MYVLKTAILPLNVILCLFHYLVLFIDVFYNLRQHIVDGMQFLLSAIILEFLQLSARWTLAASSNR